MTENPRAPGGRQADRPAEFPLRAWLQVLRRVFNNIAADNLSVVAAGVAFFAFLAVFPALGIVVAVYGLVADPAVVASHLQPLRDVMPADGFAILERQLEVVTAKADTALSLGLVVGLALALWSASKGARALIVALNIAYKEKERRNLLRLSALALAFTLGATLFFLLSLAVIAVIPVLVELFDVTGVLATGLLWTRWLVMCAFVVLCLAFVYRFGPSRRQARLQWVTPGAVAAAFLWFVGSIGFSFYVSHIGDYDKAFGSLGAAVALMMWLYISAYVVCLGAELNAELEHQTSRDSTIGPARPVGAREAHVADHTYGQVRRPAEIASKP